MSIDSIFPLSHAFLHSRVPSWLSLWTKFLINKSKIITEEEVEDLNDVLQEDHQQRRYKSCVFSAELHSSLFFHVYPLLQKSSKTYLTSPPISSKIPLHKLFLPSIRKHYLYITTIFTIMTSPFLPPKSFLYFFISHFFQTHKIMSSHLL